MGAYIDGIPMQGMEYIGGSWDFLRPFPLVCGLGVVIVYALLGSTWLIIKTEGALQERMLRLTKPLTVMIAVAIIVVTVWTPLVDPSVIGRWFSRPNIYFFVPVPILVACFIWRLRYNIHSDNPHHGSFVSALGIVFIGYTGLAISIWPNIIPPHIAIWAAASPSQSQGFALVGTLFMIPIILGYTAWSYFVFRGKVKIGDGYH